MSDNKIEAAQHQMNGAVSAFLSEIKSLQHQLELMEKRALDWEQMHLDQININNDLNKQNNDLRKALDEAHAAIRDQVERNMKGPKRREETIGEGLERLAREEKARTEKWQNDELVRREHHNKHMQDQVSIQTEIMKVNAEGLKIQTAQQAQGIEMTRKMIEIAERQNEILNGMMHSIEELVFRGRP